MCAHAVRELVGRDVDAVEPQRSIDHSCERVGDLDLAESQAFHLAALQHDSGLDRVEDGVVVARFAIGRDDRVVGVAP